jgi:hypothetical protein
MSASQSTLTGSAGVYWVMHQLLRRGIIVALAPEGVPNIDLIISDIQGSKVAALQVKTRNPIGNDKGWHMKAKHEKLNEDNLFYCFVDLPADLSKPPTTYILPSKTVADCLSTTYCAWLETPGRGGRAHQDTEMRRLLPEYSFDDPRAKKYSLGWLEPYKEAWDILPIKG